MLKVTPQKYQQMANTPKNSHFFPKPPKIVKLKILNPKNSPSLCSRQNIAYPLPNLYNFDPHKPHFYIVKVGFTGVFIIFIGLGGSVGCAVRLETRRSRVQPPPRSATFFRGSWSWNIFYGHSLPSADSGRAVVSFWRKNVHNTG